MGEVEGVVEVSACSGCCLCCGGRGGARGRPNRGWVRVWGVQVTGWMRVAVYTVVLGHT
jgi:hypothetical protein